MNKHGCSDYVTKCLLIWVQWFQSFLLHDASPRERPPVDLVRDRRRSNQPAFLVCSRVLISLCGPKTETWKADHGLSRVSSWLQHDAVCVEKLLGSLVVGRVIHDIEDDCCSSPLCDCLKADVDLPSDSLVFVVDPMTSTTCFLCSAISGFETLQKR